MYIEYLYVKCLDTRGEMQQALIIENKRNKMGKKQ